MDLFTLSDAYTVRFLSQMTAETLAELRFIRLQAAILNEVKKLKDDTMRAVLSVCDAKLMITLACQMVTVVAVAQNSTLLGALTSYAALGIIFEVDRVLYTLVAGEDSYIRLFGIAEPEEGWVKHVKDNRWSTTRLMNSGCLECTITIPREIDLDTRRKAAARSAWKCANHDMIVAFIRVFAMLVAVSRMPCLDGVTWCHVRGDN